MEFTIRNKIDSKSEEKSKANSACFTDDPHVLVDRINISQH